MNRPLWGQKFLSFILVTSCIKNYGDSKMKIFQSSVEFSCAKESLRWCIPNNIIWIICRNSNCILLNWISWISTEMKKSWFSVITVFVSNQNCTYILDFINIIIFSKDIVVFDIYMFAPIYYKKGVRIIIQAKKFIIFSKSQMKNLLNLM